MSKSSWADIPEDSDDDSLWGRQGTKASQQPEKPKVVDRSGGWKRKDGPKQPVEQDQGPSVWNYEPRTEDQNPEPVSKPKPKIDKSGGWKKAKNPEQAENSAPKKHQSQGWADIDESDDDENLMDTKTSPNTEPPPSQPANPQIYDNSMQFQYQQNPYLPPAAPMQYQPPPQQASENILDIKGEAEVEVTGWNTKWSIKDLGKDWKVLPNKYGGGFPAQTTRKTNFSKKSIF